MFKNVSVILLAFSACLVLANEPISVTITGPHKIFTNDIVVYTATTEGSTPSSYTWSVTGGSGVASGNTFTLTAPSTAANVTIQCTVTGSGNNPQSDSDTFHVPVVVPQIMVSRQSFKVSDFQNNVTIPGKEILDENGTAYIHNNRMELNAEKLYLTIQITPSDVEVQQLELTTSDTTALKLCNRAYNYAEVNLPYTYSGAANYISNFPLLGYLCVEGKTPGENYKVNLTINNNQKLSINYNVYGIASTDFHFPIPTSIKNKYKTCFPNLVDNEWGYVSGSANVEYNCIAYSIKVPPKINNIYFWVIDAVPTSFGLTPSNPTMPSTIGNGCVTSMDTFGNNNGVFEDSDIASFFTHSYWGNYISASTIGESKILYYSGFHAAKKSSRSDGCYSSWNMFESKCGPDEIIIHRAEQLNGGTYGNIDNNNKYK